MKLHFLKVLFFVFLVSGCSVLNRSSTNPTSLLPEEYFNYISKTENGLVKSIELAPNKYTLQYKPKELEAYRSLNTKFSKSEYDFMVKEKLGYQYFTLVILSETNENVGRDRLSKYLSFLPNENLKICTASDTVSCITSHYLSPSIANEPHKLLIVFKMQNLESDFKVRFKNEFLKTTLIDFKYNKEDIDKVPTLKIQG